MILTPAQGNDPPPRGYKGRHCRETCDKWEGLRSDGDKEASGGLHGWLDGRERVAPCKQPKQLATPKVDKRPIWFPPGTTPTTPFYYQELSASRNT